MGYGYAAVETIHALQRKQVKVSYNTTEPLVHISFVQPEYYQGIPDQYRIGYTPWESTEIPESWKIDMPKMDEIWTTSNFCRDIYEENKVNKTIRVVPHGIDPEIWKIEYRSRADKFIFLHMGGPTERKGGQRVVDAFLDIFADKEDAYLILKSNGSTETRYFDKYDQLQTAGYHDRIFVIEENLEVEQLVQLYNKSHCLVYPTNGEGFGLIPFQGIATGLPTICTNATACADFAELSIPLDSKPAPGVGIHLGQWVEPDENDLRDKMLYVYENFEKARDNAIHGANIIHTTQTWDHIGEQICDILGDKVTKRVQNSAVL